MKCCIGNTITFVLKRKYYIIYLIEGYLHNTIILGSIYFFLGIADIVFKLKCVCIQHMSMNK